MEEPERLIEVVKENPCLYDKIYKLRSQKKAQIWNAIGAKFNVSGLTVCNQWRAIKDRYILLKQRLQSDPDNEDNRARLTEYKFTKLLSFLDDVFPLSKANHQVKKPKFPVRSSDTNNFEKRQTVLLIKELAKHPTLYNRSSLCFSTITTRKAALEEVVKKLKPHMPNVTADMVVKKIRIIKSQFLKENKSLTLAVVRTTDPPPQPKLWFYDMVRFLDNEISLDTNSNDTNDCYGSEELEPEVQHSPEVEEKYEDITDEYEWGDSSSFEVKPFEEIEIKEQRLEDDNYENKIDHKEEILDHKKQKVEKKEVARNDSDRIRNSMYIKCTTLLQSLSEQLTPLDSAENSSNRQCNCQKSSPHTFLGRMVESELENVSEHIFVDSKWKILRILEEAQKKHLEEKDHHARKRWSKPLSDDEKSVRDTDYGNLKSAKPQGKKYKPTEYND